MVNEWRVVLCVMVMTWVGSGPAVADPGVSLTTHLGVFFEFGDEAGFSGGFSLWVGSAIYPDVDPDSEEAAFFLAPGLELRTGFIPFLTGPNEISPQLRLGVAFPGPPEAMPDSISTPENLTFMDVKLAAIVGYRWAFAFGADNPDGRRQDEDAFRFGLSLAGPGLWRFTDRVPVPNMVEGFLDVNLDGSLDRGGFAVGFGF